MKLLFESEDCIVGLIVGILLIGLSDIIFSVPDWPLVWGIIIVLSLLMTIFDVFHTFSDLGGHIFLLILLLLNNFVDIIIELALIGFFFKFSIPFITPFFDPLLSSPIIFISLGVFFIASSLFWLIKFHNLEKLFKIQQSQTFVKGKKI